MAELIERWLASSPEGLDVVAGWDDIQRTAQRVYEMCGQQSRVHYHTSVEACNERCDMVPPTPEHDVQVATSAPEVVRCCSHGVGLDRDCGECVTEAKLGLRPLRSGKAGEDARKQPER